MEIGSKHGGVAGRLSNFTPRPFVFEDVECNSMEGLLQSFKFDKEHIQREVCKLVGLSAKRRGQKRNKAWKSKQTLWWKGVAYERNSDEYQDLLKRAFFSLAKNSKFASDLLSTMDSTFSHSIGRSKMQETVLTEREFCSMLLKTREMLKRGEN